MASSKVLLLLPPGAWYSMTMVSDLPRPCSLPSSLDSTNQTPMFIILIIRISETPTLAKRTTRAHCSGMVTLIPTSIFVCFTFSEVETPGQGAGGILVMILYLISGDSLMLLRSRFATLWKQISMLKDLS
jgi:hypothetical protein